MDDNDETVDTKKKKPKIRPSGKNFPNKAQPAAKKRKKEKLKDTHTP